VDKNYAIIPLGDSMKKLLLVLVVLALFAILLVIAVVGSLFGAVHVM